MGDTPRQHSWMNKAYWGEARNPVVLTFPMLETSLCRTVRIVTWERKEWDQEYFKYCPFPTSHVPAALAPTASSVPVPQHWGKQSMPWPTRPSWEAIYVHLRDCKQWSCVWLPQWQSGTFEECFPQAQSVPTCYSPGAVCDEQKACLLHLSLWCL